VKYEIRYKPAFATVFLTLNPGDRITAEADAMASMSSATTMDTKFSGGLIPGLLKAFLGGESLFVNTFSNSTQQPQQIVLTQSTIGDIEVVELKGNSICFQPGAFIACTPGVNMGVQWAGLASWISGEGLFKLKLSGKGLVFFGAYGGLTKRQVNGEFVVDTGHLVAYEPSIQMNVKMSGGLLGSVTSGEGLVNKLTGNGLIYLQSRSLDGLAKFVRPRLR
jgi:uncharacterized protein (TIGR00266 family)